MAQESPNDAALATSSTDPAVDGDAAHADFAPLAPPPSHEELMLDTAAIAEGIDELKSEEASSAEVARQLEELTGVVLSSAEVSTRSASVAANISQDMRSVMEQITASHKRSIQHSRIILGGLLAFFADWAWYLLCDLDADAAKYSSVGCLGLGRRQARGGA